jgi:AcrR family transcriptional regulator
METEQAARMRRRNWMKERILEATIKVFNEKGLKFTMDDIARELSMSKKTIYTIFQDKESLFLEMVDYCFDKIKESENAIVSNPQLSTVDKLRRILGVLPEGYREIDFRQLYSLKTRYPEIYNKVEERLETGWENTFFLINQGIEEGSIRPIQIPILKTMFEATLEQFFQRDILIRHQISYSEALDQVVEILLDGILTERMI